MRAVLTIRRSVAAAAVAIASLAIATAAGDAATGTGAVWGPAQAYGPSSTTVETVFSSISCVSAGNCVAVGANESTSGSGSTPVVAAEQAGNWGPLATVTSLPTGADTTNAANELISVSCTSATSCVAVGQYENSANGSDAMVVPITVSGDNATPGTAAELTLPAGATDPTSLDQKASLNGVSCAAGSCTAVGHYVDGSGTMEPMVAVQGSGTWTATPATPPAAAQSQISLASISCPSSGPCEAIGNFADADGDYLPWAVQVTGGVAGTPQLVTMPSDFAASPNTGSIQIPGMVMNGLDTISCPSAGVCTAVGSYPNSSSAYEGVAVPITGGTPGTATTLATTDGSQTLLNGIWCSDAQDCQVAGVSLNMTTEVTNALVGAETDGSWSQLANLALGNGNSDAVSAATGMTCAAAGVCVIAGIEAPSATGSVPVNTFFAYSHVPLSVATASLPAATVGVPYSATLQAAGGAAPDTWSISPGSLPAGLSLDAASGVISGTPTTAGQSGFVANVASSDQEAASAGLSITVAPAATQPTPTTTTVTTTVKTPPAPPTVRVAYLTTSGSKATVVLSCTGATCAGTVKVLGTEHLKGKTPTSVVAGAKQSNAKGKGKGKAKTRTITLASGHYRLAAGKTSVLTLRLSGSAAKLLTKLHSVSGYLELTPTGAKKPAVIKKLTFKAPKKPKRK